MTTTTQFVTARVLLHFLLAYDKVKHAAAVALVESGENKKTTLVTSAVVIWETVLVLEHHYHVPRRAITKALFPLLSVLRVEEKDVLLEALQLYSEQGLLVSRLPTGSARRRRGQSCLSLRDGCAWITGRKRRVHAGAGQVPPTGSQPRSQAGSCTSTRPTPPLPSLKQGSRQDRVSSSRTRSSSMRGIPQPQPRPYGNCGDEQLPACRRTPLKTTAGGLAVADASLTGGSRLGWGARS
jgi:predicted nucleic-acid-binding protein